MKDFLKEYLNIIINVLCALLFSLGFYYILINAFHAASISKMVSSGVEGTYYLAYQSNIAKINENIDNYEYKNNKYVYEMSTMEKLHVNLKACSEYLSSEEGLINNKQLLSYIDVYNINNYFVNNLIDKCYTANISWVMYDENANSSDFNESLKLYSNINSILGNNAIYVKTELNDNSSYYINTGISNSMIRNNLDSSYQLIVRNYYEFSKIVLDVTEYLIRGDQ